MNNRTQRGLDRRGFLKATVGTGLGLAASHTLALSAGLGAESAHGGRIVVIGAGIAGLSAASHLRAAGFEVVVLEARARVGGRVCTADLQGQPVDLGAQWVEADAENPVAKFCQQQALKQVGNDEDSVRVYDSDGSSFGDTEAERLHGQTQKLIDQTETLNQQRIAATQPDITMAEALRMVEAKRPATPREQRYRDWAIAAEIETSEAESAERISLRNYWAEDEEETFDNSHFLLPGGYSQVATALADGLDIRLGQPVTAIRWSPKGVEVVTEKEAIAADRVLVTLPLGVLKAGTVQFTPALPAQKLQAIQAIGVGAIHRVVLRFDRCFWRDDNQLLGYASDALGRFIEWWNHAAFTGSPILSFWSHGNAARRLDEVGEEAAVEEAMKCLRAIFTSAVTEPVASLVTNWNADPFSRGAHSCLPVGASYEQLDVLAAPLDNRLFFAGEATSRRHPATVHGTWLSGVREAERIAKAR